MNKFIILVIIIYITNIFALESKNKLVNRLKKSYFEKKYSKLESEFYKVNDKFTELYNKFTKFNSDFLELNSYFQENEDSINKAVYNNFNYFLEEKTEIIFNISDEIKNMNKRIAKIKKNIVNIINMKIEDELAIKRLNENIELIYPEIDILNETIDTLKIKLKEFNVSLRKGKKSFNSVFSKNKKREIIKKQFIFEKDTEEKQVINNETLKKFLEKRKHKWKK